MVEESAETTAVADPPPATEITDKSDKDAKIIHQVEYYFGDVNLPRDKFLLEQIKADDGWIPLDTMIKFKRLAQLTTDFGEILAALKKSDSGLLELDSENNKIRRSPHLPLPEMNEERRKALTERSAYVGRFPLDHKIDQILEFCGKNAPDYESVVMRHYHDKAENKWHFKGSIFILFKSVEACKKFIEGEEIEYNGEKLKKIWQKDYIDEKRRERIEERQKNKKKGAKNGSENKGNSEENAEAKKSDDEEKEEPEFPLGAVVNLTGFKDKSKTKREEIKAKIEGYGIPVAFIDFNLGEQAAWVRMEQKDAAKELAKKVAEEGETMKVNDDELTVRVLEGEEEEQYLVKAKEIKLKRSNNAKFNKKGGRRGGRRGGGKGRWKRSGSPSTRNDNKKQKTE